MLTAILAAALLVLPAAPAQHVARDEICPFLVLADANVHAGRGEQYEVIGTVSQGEEVDAMRRPLDGFHELARGGHVAARFLRLQDPARCDEAR
jgi:hypothetical protein